MANQFELFDIKPKKKPKPSKLESLKKRESWIGENKMEFVRKTEVERNCARCTRPMPIGSSIIKLIPFEKGKPVIKKIEYFHLKKECPEIIKYKTD